jgi:hypothetical protein
MNIPRTVFRSNAHRFRSVWILIYLMVSAGMFGMFVVMMLASSVLFAMAGLLIPMLLVVGFFAGKTEYVIDGEGLQKTILTFINGKKLERKYFWRDVKSFKEGSDMDRSMQEYNYLEITFSGGDTWQLTDQRDPTGFAGFKEVFLTAVNEYNGVTGTSSSPHQPQPDTIAQGLPTESSAVARRKIEQKKTFYETVWAKVFFWGMAVFVSSVMGFLYLNPEYGGAATSFRLSFIILPGMGYLYYRIFVKRR